MNKKLHPIVRAHYVRKIKRLVHGEMWSKRGLILCRFFLGELCWWYVKPKLSRFWMRLWNKIKDIDLLCQEQLILQCHATYFLSLTQQNHCIRISAFLKVKKEQATEAKFHPPSPSNVLFFMLFLTCYQTLNLTKKPQCIKVLKFWELPMLFLKSCRTVRSTLKGTSVSSRHLIFLSPYSHALPAPTFLAQITCFQTL